MTKVSLRSSTVRLVLEVTLALTLLLTVSAWFILGRSFADLEERQVGAMTSTAYQAFSARVSQVGKTAADYAVWDDTYAFMAGTNQQTYIDNNLLDTSLDNLGLNAYLFIDASLQPYYLKTYFPDQNEPDGFSTVLFNAVAGWVEASADISYKPHSGVIDVDDHAVVVGVSPILTSQNQGPLHGYLVLAQVIGNDALKKMSPASGYEVSILPLDQPGVSTLVPTLAFSAERSVVHAEDQDEISGYYLLTDLQGKAAFLFRLATNRDIFNSGRLSMALFTIALLIVDVIFVALILFGLQRRILSRVSRLHAGLMRVGKNGEVQPNISVEGNDELSELGEGINAAFVSLAKTNQVLAANRYQLQYETTHDLLTHFANRSGLFAYLKECVQELAQDASIITAILVIDVDQFKLVNDSYDHEMGDRVLVAISDRLHSTLRPHDFVARMGGDEFAVVLTHLDEREQAVQFAERFEAAMHQPLQVDDKQLFLSASMGIAYLTVDMDPEDLLRNADMAMYQAKRNGRATHAVFHDAMYSKNLHRMQLETELRQALRHNQWVVFYQPILRLDSSEVTSMEALIRWHHPARGLVMPGEFIEILEETGLILPVSEFVLRQALSDLKKLREAGIYKGGVSINLAPRQLQDSMIADKIAAALREAGLPPQSLTIEITERGAMADIEASQRNLNRLKEVGVHLALDDFGTGYSSLAYLKRFPIDILKIDRSFIFDLPESGDSMRVVEAVVAIGRALGMGVVAEGVEKEAQQAVLRTIGCQAAQGFLFSKGVPVDQLPEVIQRLSASASKQPVHFRMPE